MYGPRDIPSRFVYGGSYFLRPSARRRYTCGCGDSTRIVLRGKAERGDPKELAPKPGPPRGNDSDSGVRIP